MPENYVRENTFYTDFGYFLNAQSQERKKKKEMNRMNLEQMSKRRVKRVVNDLTLKRVKTNERGSQLTWWISIST